MSLPRRVHEWAADHFSFVQYPKPRRVFASYGPSWIDRLFKWGLFGWLMAIIWGGALLWVAAIAFVLLLG